MTDQLLIDLYFARDKRAVAETKEKYGAWCAAIAWRLLRDSRDVEECLSDCALAVWNAIPPQRPEHFKGWLGAIVRNRAIALGRAISDFLRTQKPGARTAFLRRYWYAESVKEVAKTCGVSESKVKMSLHRTRKKLRAFLQEEGLWQ